MSRAEGGNSSQPGVLQNDETSQLLVRFHAPVATLRILTARRHVGLLNSWYHTRSGQFGLSTLGIATVWPAATQSKGSDCWICCAVLQREKKMDKKKTLVTRLLSQEHMWGVFL
jgi:hypothetical protein